VRTPTTRVIIEWSFIAMIQASNNNILLIAPQYPPAINGLGDYAARLGQGLTDAGYTVHYAGLPQPTPVTVQPYWSLQANGTHLLQIVQQQQIHTVILNYSGYGYQRKGVPHWLVAALTEVKRAGIRIIIFFHELYANGPLWTSAFWLHPLQKKIVQRLFDMADKVFCSNQIVFDLLAPLEKGGGLKRENIGLFANIPEPDRLSAWNKRANEMVVFGSTPNRKKVYELLVKYVDDLKMNGITTIVDIGLTEAGMFPDAFDFPIQKMGTLSAQEITAVLQTVKYGAISYPPSLLGKSGVFAAYAACGLLVFNLTHQIDQTVDGLIIDQHFLLNCLNVNDSNTSEMSQVLNTWYSHRNFKHHLSAYISALALITQIDSKV